MAQPFLAALICFRFLLIMVLATGLILIAIAPRASFQANISSQWKTVRMAAIIIFSIAIGASVISIILQLINLIILSTNKILTMIINVFDFFLAMAVVGISVPLIVGEQAFTSNNFATDVKRYFYLVSGIFGLISLALYLIDLLISRCFQFADNDLYDDDNSDYRSEYDGDSCGNRCNDVCRDPCDPCDIKECPRSVNYDCTY